MHKTHLDTSFIGHPKPLFGLTFTELWERFSFYGIRSLLVLFMIATLNEGGLELDRQSASAIVGIFAGALYLATLPGGYLADNWLGQKNATLIGALLIALGHLSIALSVFSPFMFFLGLIFIVLGTGLFKTCSSVMVGLLYKQKDKRKDSGFTIFYMGINIGAFIAPLICGLVAKEYGWHLGFGVGGIGMLISLMIFYFKTIPDFKEFEAKVGIDSTWAKPAQSKNIALYTFIALALLSVFILLCGIGIIELNAVNISKNMIVIISGAALLYFGYLFFFAGLTPNERKNLIVFLVLFITATFFWSTFEQQPTSFNLFAQDYTDRIIFGWEIPTAWFQSINSLFIITLAPIMSAIWIGLSKKNREVSSIAKFNLGIIFAAISFAIMMLASYFVLNNGSMQVSPLWLIASYFFLTIGELALSPISLSLMTSIAPKMIRGQVMGLWFISLSLGNVVAGLVGGEVEADKLESLPNLFGNAVYVLLIMAIILFFLKNPLKRMLNTELEK